MSTGHSRVSSTRESNHEKGLHDGNIHYNIFLHMLWRLWICSFWKCYTRKSLDRLWVLWALLAYWPCQCLHYHSFGWRVPGTTLTYQNWLVLINNFRRGIVETQFYFNLTQTCAVVYKNQAIIWCAILWSFLWSVQNWIWYLVSVTYTYIFCPCCYYLTNHMQARLIG